jgi:aminopeptidase YwaD
MPIADDALRCTRYLSVDIGTRTIGSPGCKDAARFIEKRFLDAGLTVAHQEFDCPDWVEEDAFLELGGVVLQAFAGTFSPSCDLTAPIICTGTLAELEAADIHGKILALYGSLAQSELAAKAAIYVSPTDRRIHQILDERSPAGLLAVNPGLHARWRLIEDFDLSIPSVTVPANVGLRLLWQAGAPVRMVVRTRRKPSSSANVIGTLPGDIPAKIVLCAHYDTKVDTPGAYDNAAGVGILLALAAELSKTPHRHSFEFIAFSGEEIYGLGDMTYARLSGEHFEEVTAALNFDGVGPVTGSTSMAVFAASNAFANMASDIASCYPGVIQVDPWPASDHYIFYSNGVPALAFTSVGIRDVYHTPYDTFDWISREKLGETAALAMDILMHLDNKNTGWTRSGA